MGISMAAGAHSCCDDACIKLALVGEAEALIPDALQYAETHCCPGCPVGLAVQLPGRCLEVFGGELEEHRLVDIWDCNAAQWAWQLWHWGANSTLVNANSGKCLSVQSYAPARMEQSSSCSTYWRLTREHQLVDLTSGLCLYVDGRVTGKDRDANFTVK